MFCLFFLVFFNVRFSPLNQRKHLNQTTGDHLCVKLIWRNTYKYQCSQILTISAFKMTLESLIT